MASAVPVTYLAQERLHGDDAQADATGSEARTISSDDLPFRAGPPAKGTASPDDASGPSSRQASLFSAQNGRSPSGSALVGQLLGAAELMGHHVEVPELPYHAIADDKPLRAAILAWVAVTGAPATPHELAHELERADALPVELQRDLALLVLSATKAHLLQEEALAALTPAQQQWVRTHPEVAEDLAQGIDTPETLYLAALTGLVDMRKSIEASVLMLEAVEATRGSLSHEAARRAIEASAASPLDEPTRDLLALLVSQPGMMSDADKVRYAARIVAQTSGVAPPARAPDVTFPEAVANLLSATGQVASPQALDAALARADLLPADLQRALAGVIDAQAAAVRAASPETATLHTQTQAMLGVLFASADALPVLQKYGLFWAEAPDALRVGQWDPATRAGWAAEHAGLFLSTKGDLADITRAGAYLHGVDIPASSPLPTLTLPEAVALYARTGGMTLSPDQMRELQEGAKRLSPTVERAAALLVTATAEAWRLDKLAYAQLTSQERDELMAQSLGLDQLYAKSSLTEAELARIERVVALSSRVDGAMLARSQLVAAEATMRAREMLAGYQIQGEARVVETGFLAFLQRALPWGTARAQADTRGACDGAAGLAAGATLGNVPHDDGQSPNGSQPPLVSTDCPHDVLLRINDPLSTFTNGFEANCDADECWMSTGAYNVQLLVISGTGSGLHMPHMGTRMYYPNTCGKPASGNAAFNCFTSFGPMARLLRSETVPQYGAARVWLDLGGSDTYQQPVAMTFPNMSAPVSIHLEMGGNEIYADPTSQYDLRTSFRRWVGTEYGHPTQGSALWGGVAILVDAQGVDSYNAPTRSQGFGRYGLGALVDLGGQDDRYDADAFSQGAASDTLNLGLGVLVDQGGSDRYRAKSGMGYGLGGVLIDAAGRDTYSIEQKPQGLPIVHLDVLPGGDLTTLHERGDNHIWLDGPDTLNIGLGLDVEVATVSNTDSDADSWSDLAEFIAGSDPKDADSRVPDGPNDRVAAILVDTDRDLYPDFVERALSSDPENPASYPAGFPTAPVFWVPRINGLVDQVTRPDEGLQPSSPVATPTGRGSDKIVDLQVPIQQAGSIDKGCVRHYANVSDPGMYSAPRLFGFGAFPGFLVQSVTGGDSSSDGTTKNLAPDAGENGVDEDAQKGAPRGYCVVTSLSMKGPGEGNLTVPKGAPGPGPITPGQPGSIDEGTDYTFRVPTGILAIGDLVDTRYAADYFVAIDLGGDDVFTGNAGGALLVTLKPQGASTTGPVAFAAPSLVLNVDLSKVTGNRSEAQANGTPVSIDTKRQGNDRYANASVDATQGAFFGVLIDNAGADLYEARNLSQGALGGLLLDLAGDDTYRAGSVSQGASMGGGRSGGAGHAGYANNARPTSSDQGARGNVPGLLLDMGEGNDHYTAAGFSQGFARTFYMATSDPSATNAGPRALALLLDQGGNDTYVAKDRAAGHQAVAGYGGTALLVDLKGNDNYTAWGLYSHAATISLTHGTDDNATSDRVDPAVAVLLDLHGADKYRVHGLGPSVFTRSDRNENLTLTRQETTTSTRGSDARARVFAEVALHLDATADPADPTKVLNGVGGTGGGAALTANTDAGFIVNLPTARLAIGGTGPTTYNREYALVIDLGGENVYDYNAGGLVRDIVAQTGDASNTFGLQGGMRANEEAHLGGERSQLALFPVSLLVDVGDGARSVYRNTGGFAQGSGLFGVGVLVDMGGPDVYTVTREPIPSLSSSWLTAPPIVDGTIGNVEWSGVPAVRLTAVDNRDNRFSTPLDVRIGNDARELFIALQGKSESGPEFPFDGFIIDLNQGRRPVNYTHDPANGINRTGLDQVTIAWRNDRDCAFDDRGFGWGIGFTGLRSDAAGGDNLTVVKCRMQSDGNFSIEIRKPLVRQDPDDPMDIAYDYDEAAGWVGDRELGLRIEFIERGRGTDEADPVQFVWPPGTTHIDGALQHRRNANLSDELAAFAGVGLAQLGQAGVATPRWKAPALSQGAALAGVGVLAMLGETRSDARLNATALAQGYAAYQGLAILADAGGNDDYEAAYLAQGAVDARGLALFLEADGDDNYTAMTAANGWTRTAAEVGGAANQGAAFFLDLNGDDRYRRVIATPCKLGAPTDVCTLALEPPTQSSMGNNAQWRQNNAFGLDHHVFQTARSTVQALTLNEVFRAPERVNLSVFVYDETATDPAARCARQPGTIADKLAVSGKVCLQVLVNTTSNTKIVNGNSFGNLSVTGVDFVLDGYRVANATGTRVNGTTDLWRFSAIVDLTDVVDGVSTLRATATFAVDATTAGTNLPKGQERRGVIVFQDPVTDDPSPAVKRIFVDNAPTATVKASPPFVGIANASWSASAYGANQELQVTWTVAHDAEEDLYEAYHGWAIPPTHRNVPCAADTEALCNVLPFYLRFRPSTAADVLSNPSAVIEGEFSTTPAPDAAGVIRTESGGQAGTHWSQRSPKLAVPLEIHKDNSFRLTLPGRQALWPEASEYKTQIRVYVLDEKNNTVRDATGHPWSLAAGGNGMEGLTFTVQKPGSTDGAVQLLREMPGAGPQVTTQFDTVASTMRSASGNLRQQNPVLGLLQTAMTAICPVVPPAGTVNVRGTNDEVCMSYNGTWQVSNQRLCTGKTPSGADMTGGPYWSPVLFASKTPQLQNLPPVVPESNPQVRPTARAINEQILVLNGMTIVAANQRFNDTYPAGTTPNFCDEFAPRNITEKRVAPPFDFVGPLTSGFADDVNASACLFQPGKNGCPGGETQLNWQDFYFDVNRSAPADPKIQVLDDRVVLPVGYQLKLDFNATDEGIVGRRGAGVGFAGDIVDGLVRDAFDLSGIETLTVPLGGTPEVKKPGIDSTAPSTVCAGRDTVCKEQVLVRETPADQTVVIPVRGPVEAQLGGTGAGLRRVDRVNPVVAFFMSDGGDPAQQPRFEVRVPTKPSTLASVLVQDGEGHTVATLRGNGYAEGDVPGSPTNTSAFKPYPVEKARVLDFDAEKSNQGLRYSQRVQVCDGSDTSGRRCNADGGGPLGDGIYTVRVRADDNGRIGEATTKLVVDSTAPRTIIVTPEYAGSGILVGGSRIPVTWITEETRSGLLATAVWMRVGSTGEWKPVSMAKMFPESISELTAPGVVRTKNVLKETSDEYWFIAVGVDRAGNVEGSVRANNLSNALKEGFQSKRDACVPGAESSVCRRVVVDQTRPTVGAVGLTGSRLVSRDGLEFHYIKGGSPVAFSVCAGDAQGKIGRVNLSLDYIDAKNGTVTSSSMEIARDPAGCADGSERFVGDQWHLTNADKSKAPDGIWAASFDVYDLAGNRVQVPVANIVLDSTPPDVTPLPLVLPGDQSAVKPGDVVKLRLHATDRFDVDSVISVDARSLTKSIPRTIRASDGALEATFTVDRADVRNGVETVRVTVRDVAGNERVVEFFVPVNFRSFKYVEGSLRVTDVTHNSLVLRWETDENTTAYVRSGTLPLQLSSRTPTNVTPTKSHAINVTGLQPSTRYYLKAVSASTGGHQVESDVIEAVTDSALRLTVFSPAAGDSVSGAVPVRFRGLVLDSDALVTFTLEAQPSPDKPWSFDKVATRQGGNHTLTFNSSHFLDTTTFRLRLTAESGKDRTSVVIGPFTSDNTPPTVTVLSPLIATNDTTPLVQAEVTDELSGLGPAPATLLIDGKPVAETLVYDRIDGGVRVSHEVPSALSPGMHTFELRVQDKAGNVVTGEKWTVSIDGDAPKITLNPTRFSPGTSAAKAGGTLTLNLTVKDVSGVSAVSADTSEISTQTRLALVRLVGSDVWTGTVPVTAAEAAAKKTIVVTAIDLAGNAVALPIEIDVDNVAPKAGEVGVLSATHTKAVLEVRADEPVLLSGNAAAGSSPPVSAATRVASAEARLTLDGLLPSRTYTYELEVVDRAGNAITRRGSFDTLRDVVAPSAVGPLSVLDLLNGTLRLSWPAATDDVGIDVYRVYRSEDGTTFRAVAEVAGTTYDDAGLPYERSFVYKVAAVDHGGNEGPAPERLRASATAVPRLSGGIVSPTLGTVTTPFQYVVTYLSPGGVAPAFVRVHLNGVPQEMTLQSGDPASGAVYVFETKLAPHKRDEPHVHSYEASDGRYTARFPEDGSAMRGPLVSADAAGAAGASGFASFARQVPGFGVAPLAFAVAFAVALALIARRKGGSQ